MAKRTVSNTHEDFTPGSLDVILPTSCRSSKTVAQRHGVTFAFGNTNYSPGAFRVRLEAKRDGGDKRDFEEYAASCGLNPADFGAFFTCQNRKYTVSGINLFQFGTVSELNSGIDPNGASSDLLVAFDQMASLTPHLLEHALAFDPIRRDRLSVGSMQ